MVANRSCWIFAALFTLAACGGGASFEDDGTDGGTDTPGEAATLALDLTAWSCPEGTASNTVDGCSEYYKVTPGVPTRLRAVLSVTSGTFSVANRQIVFAAPQGLLSPLSGEVSTDGNGVAYATLSPSGTFEINDTLSATYAATVDTNQYSVVDTTVVRYVQTDVKNLSLTLTTPWDLATQLPDGSTIAFNAAVLINGELPTVAVTVNFSSQCAETGKAEIDSAVSVRSDGIASSSYKVTGCSGQDFITATVTVGGETQTQTLSVTIKEEPAARIEFVEAVPDYICLEGSGCPGSSVLQFKVLDALGQPKQGTDVSFELLFNQGTSGLNGLARISSSTTAITNSSGVATVTVVSGTLPVSPRVKATSTVTSDSDSYDITAVSGILGIGTGMPHQAGFSIAFDKHNVEGGNVDGEEVAITASLADHFGNPVPDGTSVTFVSPESGHVTPNCLTTDGRCSVTWVSSGDRPLDNRVTILAYATGEDSFQDADGNGIYNGTPDYVVYDMPEPFVDANENGVYDAAYLGEQLIDTNLNGDWDDANGKYDGLLCDINLAGSDVCDRNQIQVIQSQEIALSYRDTIVVKFCADSTCDNVRTGTDVATLAPGTVYACAFSPAGDGLTWNPIAAGAAVAFAVEDPLRIVGRSSFTMGSTSTPVLVKAGADTPAYWNSCGAGRFYVTVSGVGPLRVEVTTDKGSFGAASVAIAP